ncbi:hypothetical protein EJB05_01320, partial [Eragrostis curvula]
MEIALSAFLGEIVQRSISFFIDRLSSKEASPCLPSDEALRRKLLRVRIIVEEAEGRQIKNTAMLEQLKLLQAGMYRGYYVLDNFRYRDYQAHNCKSDHGAPASRHSFALSKFNPAKRVQLRGEGSRGHHGDDLDKMIFSLRDGCRVKHQSHGSGDRDGKVLFIVEVNGDLLRVRIVVEEAEGRHIKNTAMLEQLKLLQVGMYRGYYVLDTFRYRDYQAHNCKHDHGARVSSHSFGLSKFNPAKCVQLCGGGSRGHHGGEKELQQVIGSLEVTITDASEFIMFLKGCPPLYRRPYSTHLVLEKTMFGRHVEMEYIVNFLKTSSVEDFDVLPVVGPIQVGKSTLIEHACADERVRAAFSQIVYAPNGGKVVICSRSDKIERFGTSRALKMEYLSQEAYWYRFRALAFGSKNPDDEPKLASMAMEIAARLTDVFIAGNVTASMLRDNFSVRFWRKALSCATEVSKRNHFKFGAQPSQRRELVHILNGSGDYCIVFNDYQIVSGQDKVPKITFQEIMSGSVAPRGKFDAVAWRSSIPPHYSYIFSCEIHKAPQLDARKKRVYRATVDSNP